MSNEGPAPVPDFLTSLYRPGALERAGSTLAALDARGKLLWVNEAWYRFARANGHEFELERYPSYLDGISGPFHAEYARVLADVVASGAVFEQDYECSSADVIRQFRMRVLPFLPGGLLVEHTQIASHPAPAGEPALEQRFFDDNQQITQCSNCRRVRRIVDGTEAWAWVPDWVAHSHPRTSHGICTLCLGYYWRQRKKRGP